MNRTPASEDKIGFFSEQTRLRKKTWHITALSIPAILIMGLPLSIIAAPVFYLLILLLLKTIGIFLPLSQSVWDWLKTLLEMIPLAIQRIREPGGFSNLSPGMALYFCAAYFSPGILSLFFLWLGLTSLFVKAGTGGVLLHLGVREPSGLDREETQLVNIVEEMSISAGIPAPKVALLDSEVPNAAVVGSSGENAVIVVTRGFLEVLNREQTQAGIAHLIASAGNGDLKVAVAIMSLFQTFGILSAISEGLLGLSPSARRDLFHALQWMRAGAADDPRTADAMSAMLTRSLDDLRDDGLTAIMNGAKEESEPQGLALWMRRFPPLRILMIPCLVGYGISLMIRMEIIMIRTFLVGPLTMLIWRTRRHLADAMAVQLTRNPEGLAGALEILSEKSSVVPGGQWASHLFIVGTEAVRYRIYRAIEEAGEGKGSKPGEPKASEDERPSEKMSSRLGKKRYVAELTKLERATFSEEIGGIVSSHPPLEKRLSRIRLMGADVEETYLHRKKPAGTLKEVSLLTLLSPLLVLGALVFLSGFLILYAVAGLSTLLLAGAILAIAGFLIL